MQREWGKGYRDCSWKSKQQSFKLFQFVFSQANLTHDAYRIDPEGKVGVSQILNFTDEISEDDYNNDDYEEGKNSYLNI